MLRFAKVVIFALLCSLSLVATQSSTKYIVPGAVWRDTDGNVINAHGAGIFFTNNTFFWVGGTNGCCADSALYSSPDLVTWTNHGIVFTGDVSRPKLVYSETTKMWQLMGQTGRQLLIASSPTILGPYTSIGAPFSPFGVNFTDFGLFRDDDGEAYVLYSADHNALVLSQVSDDRRNLTAVIHQWPGVALEAPAMFKEGDTYYVMGSHKTGYLVNNDVIYSAQNLSGPWSIQSSFAPLGSRTWNTQSTFVLNLKGTGGRHVNMYMGDRWVVDPIGNSTYVWLPLSVNSVTKGVQAEWHDVWSLDTKTAEMIFPRGTKYEAEAGLIVGNGAYIATCPECSGNKIVTGISAGSSLTIKNITGRGEPQWVSFYYINTDGAWGDNTDVDKTYFTKMRNATVSLNGGPAMALPQQDTNVGIVLSVPLQLNMTRGSSNSITVAAIGSQLAGDLDYIMVY